jgi:hypothetical protein
MPTYKQNKIHIYKWRENNNERHKEMSAKYMAKYRSNRKSWKEIQSIFLNILLDI